MCSIIFPQHPQVALENLLLSTDCLQLYVLSFACNMLLYRPGFRFTKYLTTVLRLSYDKLNAKVMINLQRMSNLQSTLRGVQGFS